MPAILSKNTPEPAQDPSQQPSPDRSSDRSPDRSSDRSSDRSRGPSPEAGLLALVVGPSGVGKDTLIDGARAALAGAPDIVFPHRHVTRPTEAGGEPHIEISEADFAALEASGGFALAWRAHGLGYGIGADIDQDLAAGRTVVVNVSRQTLAAARARYRRVRVISVTASLEHLAERLRRRGRESEAEIALRLARAEALAVAGDDVVVVRNDGAPEAGVAAFIAALRG